MDMHQELRLERRAAYPAAPHKKVPKRLLEPLKTRSAGSHLIGDLRSQLKKFHSKMKRRIRQGKGPWPPLLITIPHDSYRPVLETLQS